MMTKLSYSELQNQIQEFEKSESDYKLLEEKLKQQIVAEKLISSISIKFITLGCNDINIGINYGLQRIAEFTKADRIYVLMYSEHRMKFENIFEWCKDGIEPLIEDPEYNLTKTFLWSIGKLKQYEIIDLYDIVNLPEEARGEKEIFQSGRVKSFIHIPMFYGGFFVGFIGLNAVNKNTTWTEEHICLLTTSRELFSNALIHDKAWEARKKIEEQHIHSLYIANQSFSTNDFKLNKLPHRL